MSIADKLRTLANTKEALRIKLGLGIEVPFSDYVNSIVVDSETPPVVSNDISGKLELVLHTKEMLRLALSLDASVPFNEYVTHVVIE